MSSTDSTQLTEEQEKLLYSLEEEFKDRYTENDEEFKAVLNERLPQPPIVENWGDFRNRGKRHDNYRPRYNRYEYNDDRHDRRNRNGRRYDPYYHDDGGGYSHSSRQDYRHRNYYSDSYRS